MEKRFWLVCAALSVLLLFFLAPGPSGGRTDPSVPSASTAADSPAPGSSSGPSASASASSPAPSPGPVGESLAAEALTAFAAAGTPFFTDVSVLTAPQMEEAALWLLMARGEMPLPEDGEVRLPAGTLMAAVEALFGLSVLPEGCALAAYDPESGCFTLPAGALFPAQVAVPGPASGQGASFTMSAALYPASGWEGDTDGRLYRPEQSAAARLTVENGHILSYAGA